MYSRKLRYRDLLGSALLLLLLTVSAGAQSAHYSVPAASVDDPFSAYHEALNGAADNLLAASDRSTEMTMPAAAAETARPDHRLVRQFAQRYWDGQETNVRRALDRVAQLRLTLDPILQEEGVPVDLAALVLVESGGRAMALSPKGALGLWQFMPETARRYGLAVNPGQDERLDVSKSTRAAARYLRDLYTRFGDWKLVLAAYNSGEQTVESALARNRSHDFETLSQSGKLPLETRNYVPAAFSAIELLGGKLRLTTIHPSGRRSIDSRLLYASSEVSRVED